MSWIESEPIKGGVVYGQTGEVVGLDDIPGDVPECMRAHIQGDPDHLAGCIKCQENGAAQEEGVLDGYLEPSDYHLLTPKRK
jgi:hypothetical protein